MTDTAFTDSVTVIPSSWLNDVNRVSYGVASILALKALTAPTGPVVVSVHSYYAQAAGAEPDGGGGDFLWNSADVTADNGGTVIAPNAGGTGRWNALGKMTSRRWGAKGDKTTDDTARIQAAITYCIANNQDLEVDGICVIDPATMVNIDRQVDGLAFDNYFKIFSNSGGGFILNATGAMFTSTIAFTTAPVSQLILFDGITFESSAAGAYYVLNDGRFLRTVFSRCNFDKILCVNSTIYLQTYRFDHCNMRRGNGTFFKATTYSTDIKAIGNIVEAWTGNVFDIQQAQGDAFLGNLIEGVTSGTAIVYNGAQGLDIAGNYFESNGLDIDGTAAVNQALGVSIIGNKFAHSPANQYSVIWGVAGQIACVSLGNYHNGSMHSLAAGADVLIKDTASTSLFNNTPTPSFSSQNFAGLLALSLSGTITSSLVSGASILAATTATVNAKSMQLQNTGGNLLWGVESSAGGALATGAAAYATVYNTVSNTLQQWATNGTLRMTLGTGLQIGSPTGGDQGSGTINVGSDIYKNGLAYTNPDYVFEHWANGKIKRFADKEGASRYKGRMSIGRLKAYCKRHLHLPGFGQRANNGIFGGSEKLLGRLEEAYIYIFELEDRLSTLERKIDKMKGRSRND